MFKQISIKCISTNNWTDSTITVYNPADSAGFIPAPATLKVSDLSSVNLAKANLAIGYLIADALRTDYYVDYITVNKTDNFTEDSLVPDSVNSAVMHSDISTAVSTITNIAGIDSPATVTTSIATTDITIPSSNTLIVVSDPIIVVSDPVVSTDVDGNTVTTTTTVTTITTTTPIVIPAHYIQSVNRVQLNIAVTSHLLSTGAEGTRVFSSETLPSAVRDAWLDVIANY